MKSLRHGEKPALAPVSMIIWIESELKRHILLFVAASKAHRFDNILKLINWLCNVFVELLWAMDKLHLLYINCL